MIESTRTSTTGASADDARRLKLGSASFLNGTALPRSLTLDASGRVIDDASVAAAEIDLGDVVVFPALINSHDHLEFDLYPQIGDPPYVDVDDWSRDVHRRHAGIISAIESIPVELRIYWGLLRNLSWGVTAVMNHGDPQLNVRCKLPIETVKPYRHLHRADTRWAWLRARRIPGSGPLVFHVGEGTSDAVAKRSARFLRYLRGRGPLVGVHGISLAAEDAQRLDALVWCPVSNQFLFERTADISSLKGVTRILLGTDAAISAQGSIWDHLRIARACGYLTDAELLDAVTSSAASVWGLDRSGDLVIAKRRHPDIWESFFATTSADICAVISRGRLAMINDTLYQEMAVKSWQEIYRSVEIESVRHRIYCPMPATLERLASIRNAPVTLPVNL